MAEVLLVAGLLLAGGAVLGLVALRLWRRSRALLAELAALGDALPGGPPSRAPVARRDEA